MRREDWQSRLAAVLEDAEARPFAWGYWDCGQFAGSCVAALTGDNPMTPFRGRWDTEQGMLRALSEYHGDLATFWTSLLGPAVEPALAGRGDVVLVDIEGVQATGVVDLSGERAACLTLDGLEYAPLSAVLAAWKVD